MALHPYLLFSGNCRQAFERYEEIFGGDLVLLSMKDLPEGEEAPTDNLDLIMHAALTFDGGILMASDDPTGDGGPKQGICVNYTTPTVAEAERVFAELAKGGEVQMPIGETFWSPRFGMCVDRFGIPWMVNAEAPAEGS